MALSGKRLAATKWGRIMVVSEKKELVGSLCKKLATQGYETMPFDSGAEALKALKEQSFDVLLTDLIIPGLDGIALLQKALKTAPNIIGIVMAEPGTALTALKAMKIGYFDHVLKPVEIEELMKVIDRSMELRQLRQEKVQLRSILYETAKSLASALEKRNPNTAGHQERVTTLGLAIAREMNLDEEIQEGIRLASTLQNIGMLNVPTDILSKLGRLNELEYELIKTHPEVGNKILENIEFPWPVSEIICQHHERMDGSGYPRELKGEDILLEARILALADVVEAMTSQRFHRPSLGIDKVIEEISKNRGILYDPKVVDAFLKIYRAGKLSPSG